MIDMMIFSRKEKELVILRKYSGELAGRLSEEKWEYHCLKTSEEAEAYLRENPLLDLACMDISGAGGVERAARVRSGNQHAYLILIADPDISPAAYLRPGIMAGSLLLRPLSPEQIYQVQGEAFREFCREFEKEDGREAFVVENREGKWMIDYEQINYFESREKKICLCTDSREIAFYDTMERLEQKLPEEFLRCHRSFLVNRKKIRRYFPGGNFLELHDRSQIPVSRSYRNQVKECLA